MDNKVPSGPGCWSRSRYGFAVFYCLSLLAGWFLLRLVLFFAFRSPALSVTDILRAFLSGFQRDLFAGLLETIPLLVWLLLIPNRRFSTRSHQVFFWSVSFLLCFGQVFLLCIEFFFFEEFKSRFNTVAVDYLIYPQEVFVNIWESYHVGLFLGLCALLSLAWVLAARKLFTHLWERPFSAKTRLAHLGAAAVLAGLVVWPIHLKAARISEDRGLNEIANNGVISFVMAALTRHLDYGAFYKTLPLDEAYPRARRMLAEDNSTLVEPGQSIQRQIAGHPNRPRLNVVLILEESLGSEFWGCLGRKETLTPQMDSLAAEAGLLFTNIYACGNRTVRGMEGVLASFPPLPGDSIVRRDLSDNVETIARVLKRDGYATLFVYGGRGVFDGMRSFAVRNGYDRFIEQKHFQNPTFTTSWGVCDEDLFARALQKLRELSKTGQPFFSTILSVSNHKPYTYPKGRIAEDPDKHKRNHAVKYSDYCLGEFFRGAKKEPFWTNTIFVVVADHGARVYGRQSIPIHSYEIPLLIVGPAVIQAPGRAGQLGSSLDVAPTILGLIGRPCQTLFFGHDLLNSRAEQARAFLNHNRDIGMVAGDRLVVLGLNQTVEFYAGDPKRVEMRPLPQPTDSDRELEKDAIAMFQVAYDMYVHQRYHLDAR